MAVKRIEIQPSVMEWVFNQLKPEKIGEELMDLAEAWKNGTKIPTAAQILKLSKKSNIPYGYFFYNSPPEEELPILEFRTLDSKELANPSRELIDTVFSMSDVQEFMREFRLEQGFTKVVFVGCAEMESSTESIAGTIRRELELKETWYRDISDSREAFNLIRGKAAENFITVMMNGVVNDNTHRPLNIEEFRAFAITDEFSPLIFINSADSPNARLFSLLHEIVHIALGRNDFFNDRHGTSVNPLETKCNAVAAELLIPKKEFISVWNKSTNPVNDRIQELAKYFRCSTTAIARRALDQGFISKRVYEEIAENARIAYSNVKAKTGGNYYKTKISKLDRNFMLALCISVAEGNTSYTDAWRLSGTNRKTFDKLVEEMGIDIW